MSISLKSITLLLIILSMVITRSHLPDVRYSRLDDRWKNDQLVGKTIGDRPNIFTTSDFSCNSGSHLSIVSSVLFAYGIQCDVDDVPADCTPPKLWEMVVKYVFASADFRKILKVLGVYDPAGDDFEWEDINRYLSLDTAITFVTQPIKNNVMGAIYEVDMNTKTFKFFDDLGVLGEGKFEDVASIEVFFFDLSGKSLKFLE
jgi:hypothetical protein